MRERTGTRLWISHSNQWWGFISFTLMMKLIPEPVFADFYSGPTSGIFLIQFQCINPKYVMSSPKTWSIILFFFNAPAGFLLCQRAAEQDWQRHVPNNSRKPFPTLSQHEGVLSHEGFCVQQVFISAESNTWPSVFRLFYTLWWLFWDSSYNVLLSLNHQCQN